MHDADNTLKTSTIYNAHLILYYSGNFEMSIHDSWEDLPPTVTGYYSHDADMEAEGGKVSKESLRSGGGGQPGSIFRYD
jgi:hypothetical protein